MRYLWSQDWPKQKEITLIVGEENVVQENELSQLVGVYWYNSHFGWQQNVNCFITFSKTILSKLSSFRNSCTCAKLLQFCKYI